MVSPARKTVYHIWPIKLKNLTSKHRAVTKLRIGWKETSTYVRVTIRIIYCLCSKPIYWIHWQTSSQQARYITSLCWHAIGPSRLGGVPEFLFPLWLKPIPGRSGKLRLCNLFCQVGKLFKSSWCPHSTFSQSNAANVETFRSFEESCFDSFWLVVWNIFYFSIIYGVILPIDKYFSRWLKHVKTTNQVWFQWVVCRALHLKVWFPRHLQDQPLSKAARM